MDSWWDLGDHAGFPGDDLALYRIECPFCGEKGNFSTEHHAEKKKPNSSKKLNFDTLKCGNCAGYVMVFWSASENGGYHGLHYFKVLPWPLETTSAPDYWPPTVQRYWIQAHKNITGENWDAAAMMSRSALQIILRDHKATGKGLRAEIEDLATKGVLPPLMKDWSSELKELGDNATHPEPDQEETQPRDAQDIVEFLDFLTTYLYDLPKQIKEYRERKK